MPDWIKTNAKWWAQDLITDEDFIKGVQYLVELGLVLELQYLPLLSLCPILNLFLV